MLIDNVNVDMRRDKSTPLHTLAPGDIFYIVGLENDGTFELLRISNGSAYIRSTARKTRKAFETYAGAEVKAFTVPADGHNISRNTSVVKRGE